jgi:hypothetical protein
VTGFQDVAFGLAILAAGTLAWFGIKLMRVPETRTKGVLMVVMALVLVGNVLIWTV